MLNKCRTVRHVLFQERMLLKYRENSINHVSHAQAREYIFGKDYVKYFRPTKKHFLQASKEVISQQRNSWPAHRLIQEAKHQTESYLELYVKQNELSSRTKT
jgi:hypothetical protein